MKKSRKGHHDKSAHGSRNGAESKEFKFNQDSKPGKRSSVHQTRNDLPEKVRLEMCKVLNQTVADTFDLYSQTKQAHWNVKGVHFYQLHLLFDEIASELIDYVDLFAERVTSLGGTAFGTVRMSAESTTLPEYPVGNLGGMDHVVALADRLSQFGEALRQNIDVCNEASDLDSADIYTEVSRDIDKRLWFLEAHLQAPTAERESKLAPIETGSARH